MKDPPSEDILHDIGSSIDFYTNVEPTSSVYRNITRGRNSYNVENGQSNGPLEFLFRMTDIILIIGAAIFAISIAVIISLVAVAVFRVYSIRGFYDYNRGSEHFSIRPNE
jgi:hypothetical protein